MRRTRLNQYGSSVRPLQTWLTDRGVVFEYATSVTDIDFSDGVGERRATRIHYQRAGQEGTYDLGTADYAFVTLGSMTADANYGDDDHAPEIIRDRRDDGFALWQTLAKKGPDFGRPNTFEGNIDESIWESFTLTMREPLLLHRIQEFSGNAPGTGGLMTFVDSPLLMSIVVPRPPHVEGQAEDVSTLWGYGLITDTGGDYVVPTGAQDFAFIGQYTEIPEDVVFTVEHSRARSDARRLRTARPRQGHPADLPRARRRQSRFPHTEEGLC